MKKIQVTIVIYILIILMMSIFFLPMNRSYYVYTDKHVLDATIYKPLWYTQINDDGTDLYSFIINIPVYKLYVSIISLVTLSIIAIQILQVFEKIPLLPHRHTLDEFN